MVSPRRTLRRVYTTPRGSHPCICLGLLIRFVEVSMDPKTKRDNAFQYVVLRPAARLFDKSFLACRADSICKSTNFMRNKKISLELFANIGISSYLCSVRNDYPVSFRVGARLDRHYSILQKGHFFIVALLLFCITPDECSEEIFVFQAFACYRQLLLSFEQHNFSSMRIQFKISLNATRKYAGFVICFHVQ